MQFEFSLLCYLVALQPVLRLHSSYIPATQAKYRDPGREKKNWAHKPVKTRLFSRLVRSTPVNLMVIQVCFGVIFADGWTGDRDLEAYSQLDDLMGQFIGSTCRGRNRISSTGGGLAELLDMAAAGLAAGDRKSYHGEDLLFVWASLLYYMSCLSLGRRCMK